jgi:hypothetical protein
MLAAGTTTAVWQKAFEQWTPKDAQQIMTDSPWAKQLPMPAAARPGIAILEPGSNGAPPPSASLGNPSNTTVGTNMTVAGNAGSAGPAEPTGTHNLPSTQTPSNIAPNVPAPEPHPGIGIIWASALPVRLAVLKLQSGLNTPTEGEIERVSKPRENYVIAVVGMAPPDRDTDLKDLAAAATLSVRGKSGEQASICNYHKIGNADVYFFRFPRNALAINADDRQVEFKAKFGQAEIRHRFDLKSMEYQGQLAL